MKKIWATLMLFVLAATMLPSQSLAAGGIYASGGKTVTVGSTITVSVVASGATFDTFEGTVSVSGPVSVTSFSYGDATYIGAKPSNGVHFVGTFLGDKKTSFTVATLKLKGTSVGSGSVSVASVALKNAGSTVGTGASGTSFTIQKAPELPGAVTVTSASHPDQNTAYEATTIELAWNKDSGVDNFSYLLDQVADTTPPSTATDANVAATYAGKAVGVYYFHIKAHKTDGWGPVSHFKITIKEPEAKIDESLAKPSNIAIKEADVFVNDVETGTVSGITISGTTVPNYTANITLVPAVTLPEGKTLSATADDQGNFSVLIDYPIPSGFHTLTVQGSLLKVLTPVSDPVRFEISQANGGKVSVLTSADVQKPAAKVQKWYEKYSQKVFLVGGIALAAILIIIGIVYFTILKRRHGHLIKSIRS